MRRKYCTIGLYRILDHWTIQIFKYFYRKYWNIRIFDSSNTPIYPAKIVEYLYIGILEFFNLLILRGNIGILYCEYWMIGILYPIISSNDIGIFDQKYWNIAISEFQYSTTTR